MRIKYLTSHPIQYQAPLFRVLAGMPEVDLEVLFCTEHGMRPSFDPGFGQAIRYDIPLTEGFRHRFLVNRALKPAPTFFGQVNLEIARALSRGLADALIVHGYASITNLLAILSPRKETKILLRGDANPLQRRAGWRLAVKRAILPRLLERVDHVLAIGTLNKQYWREYGVADSRITLAPFAVDNDAFAACSAKNRESVRSRLGLPLHDPVFLFCGKLVPWKRPLDAIRGLALARRAGPCALAIAGEGELKGAVLDEAKRLGVQSHVHFLGFKNQSELPDVYVASDALVLPSSRESWGLVVNEAMAAGLAVIASDQVGAHPDLVHGVGAVFPSGNAVELGAAMGRWVESPEALEEARRRSRERISSWGLRQSAEGIVEGVRRALAQ